MKKFICILATIICLFSFPAFAWDGEGWDPSKVPYTLKETAPTVNDDSFGIPFVWVDTVTDKAYLLVDNSVGAAVWREIMYTGATPSFVTVDLTGISDGNLPNMAAAAAGFEDSPLSTDGSNVTNSGATLTDGAGDADIGTEALYWQKLFLENSISFEGATDNDFQTTLTFTDPTTPDKTITFPDLTGTVGLSANNLGFFSATTSTQLFGVLSDETGSSAGALSVFSISPTFTTSILPSASGATDIGTTALEWGDFFIADDKSIQFGSGQDFHSEYNSTSELWQLSDGSNIFATVKDDGTTGEFNWFGQGDIHIVAGSAAATAHHGLGIEMQVGALNAASLIHGINFTASGTTSGEVAAIGTHGTIKPIHQHTGTYGDSDWGGINEAGADTIKTTSFNTDGAPNATLTDSNNDYFLIANATTFGEIDIDLATVASLDQWITWWYSDGSGGWIPFTPLDGTDGLTQDGIVSWGIADLVGWGTDSVTTMTDETDASVYYWIKGVRTRPGNPTDPIEEYIQILSPTVYEWDESGNLSVKAISAIGILTVSPDGTNETFQINDGTIDFTDGNAGTTGTMTIDSSGNLSYNKTITASTVTVSDDFPDIDAAETVELDITGLPGNDVQSTLIRIYLSDGVNDPGADMNVNFRLEFFSKDTKLGQDRIGNPIYFNLTYTEVKTGTWSAAGTGGDLDSSAGLIVYDWIRLMGGTAETVNLVTITDADTVVVTTVANNHVVDEGISREYRRVIPFPFSDLDGTGELHLKITAMTDPGDAIGITIAVTVK